MYKKRDKVRIKRIVLDLHDVIADSKKVAVFEYERCLFYLKLDTRRGDLKYGNSLPNTKRDNVQNSEGV